MARLSALGIENPPRAAKYESDALGAITFTQDALDWIQRLVELTDDHRKKGVETIFDAIQETVHENQDALRDLDARNPGWVAIAIRDIQRVHNEFVEQVAKDNKALLEDNKSIRSELKWMRGLALSTLLALLIFLAQQLYVRL